MRPIDHCTKPLTVTYDRNCSLIGPKPKLNMETVEDKHVESVHSKVTRQDMLPLSLL